MAAGILDRLFGHDQGKDTPELQAAIERAVSIVEPLLKQASGYPKAYRKPVATALEYSRSLADNIPGPVAVSRESYASDPFVHALFPSHEFILDALGASRSLQEYFRKFPDANDMYALMGMRRWEKSMMGMALSGQVVQYDVLQNVVYFTSHTIENPASNEKQARDQVFWSFFDSLASKVARRIEERKQKKRAQLQEKDLLTAKLRAADAQTRHVLQEELSRMVSGIQATVDSLDLRSYIKDFEEVMLNPEQHLRLNQASVTLDRMGIKQSNDDAGHGESIVFSELVGFDRRDWIVTMVHCSNIQSEPFAARLETAYRKLSIYT